MGALSIQQLGTLMFGREVTLPVDILFPTPGASQQPMPVEYVQNLKVLLEDVYHHIRKCLRRAAEAQKKEYNTKMVLHPYEVGGLVYRRSPMAKKLDTAWIGPLVVTKKYSQILYQVAGKCRSSVLHHDLLKLYPCANVGLSY